MEPKKEEIIQDFITAHVAILIVCMMILIYHYLPDTIILDDGKIDWPEIYDLLDNALVIMIVVGHSLPLLALLNAISSRWIDFRVARDLALVYSLVATYGLAAYLFGTAYKHEIRDMMNMSSMYTGIS
ncbi:MAG: hypothetical protein ACK4UW_20480 [Rhizobium rhizophilum]|uniref:hypothetical protein n=1 Tax=Rhizobium rhizophilum TaxID=1850373 RepID=UPI003919A3C9